MTDWTNLELPEDNDLNLLEAYSIDALLLEVSCNLPEINAKTVKAQALESLATNLQDFHAILDANLDSIVKEALAQRKANQ